MSAPASSQSLPRRGPAGPPTRARTGLPRRAAASLAAGVVFAAAAALGVATALPRIPAAALAPPSWAPVGQTLPVIQDQAPAFPAQRQLLDYLFAVSAGIPPDTLPLRGALRPLPGGTPVTVLRADLDYLLVRPEGGAETLWIEARALGVEPPRRSRSRE